MLYAKAREYIMSMESMSDAKVVFDLYSGTGTIAQMMSPAAGKVIGIEIVEEAVEAAKQNAELNGLKNCEFIAGDVLKAIELLAVADGELGWHVCYDEDAEAAYLYNDNPNSMYYKNYLTYESEASLKAKTDYIKDKGLAGLIVWEVSGDSGVDEYPMITQMAIELGIYDGEQPTYGQAGQIPEIEDTVSESGYPDPMYEVVAGVGSTTYPAGSYIYYKNAVWESINNASNDYESNLPDGQWGESCWTKEFDVKQYVSQEDNNGDWAWAADAGDYVFYDPDKDGIGGIYYAKAQTSNTANDAPDGIWGTNWEYVTTVYLDGAGEGYPDPMYEVVAGDGSITYPKGTLIYYKNAIWESINNASSDWPDNLPDGAWAATCWVKDIDVKDYVSQEDNNGDWAWAAYAGEYVMYDPDHDGVGAIYYATADTSNTANDAPDGIWGTNWEYVTTVYLAGKAPEAKYPYPDPMNEVVAGDGATTYPNGTYIFYKDAMWKSINDASSNWPDNLPDGQWGDSCWTKEFDAKKYVSQEDLGSSAYAALEGEYVFYDPDGDGTGAIYLALADVSNTADDAPDGQWGEAVWEYVTTVILQYQPKYADGAYEIELLADPKFFGEFQTRPFIKDGVEINTYPAGSVVSYNGTYYEAYAASSAWDAGWEPNVHPNWHAITLKADINRLFGTSRVDTALEIATEGWKQAGSVILVNGYSFADALVATPLAYAADAPILLTANGAQLEQSVIDKIVELGASEVIVIGGELVVNEDIVNYIADEMGIEVLRIYGDSRAETAAAVAEVLAIFNEYYYNEPTTEAFMSYGYEFADTLAVSTVAALKGTPILFAANDGSIDEYTAAVIEHYEIDTVTILGGKLAVGEACEDNLAAIGVTNVDRIFGTTRYDTAYAIVDAYNDLFASDDIAFATGANYPDALAGSAFAAKLGIPVILINETYVADGVLDYIAEKSSDNVYVFGGELALSDEAVLKFLP